MMCGQPVCEPSEEDFEFIHLGYDSTITTKEILCVSINQIDPLFLNMRGQSRLKDLGPSEQRKE